MGSKALKQTPETFWAKVDKSGGLDSCWLWTRSRCGLRREYGKLMYQRRPILAHRLAWILTNGEIPLGQDVLHRCDNPICCNPQHLFLGTQLENMHDMWEKGRANKAHGEGHPHHKLTETQVREIRSLLADGCTHKSIADLFHVSGPTVTNIATGQLWSWLK